MELLTPIAGWALGKAADTVWSLAADQVQTTLQHTDVERAIKAGLEAVRDWEASLEVAALLFKRCDDKQRQRFLEQVFADAGVVEQLQRPLAGEGEPDIKLLQKYFEQVAQGARVELTQDSLQPWLEIFCRTYFEKTALFIKYELARQRYLQQLTNWYDDVKFLGISVAGQEDTKSEKLLQIFVMPDVKERSESQTKNGWLKETFEQLQITLTEEINVEAVTFGEGIQEITAKAKADRPSVRAEQRELAMVMKQEGKTFSAAKLLPQSRSHRCVLLGAPGSGKTTLMSYFAVALSTGEGVDGLGLNAHYLPILVRIRDWIQSAQNGLLDYIRAFATEKLSVKDFPDGFFEHWLEAGKALILLDGLDEVANEARRDEVVNQIEVFLQAQSYRDNPAIITSRPAGYKQAYFRTEEFPHYDLLPFDQPKIDTFIQNWYDNRFRDRAESQRRQKTLKKALSERDRIQVLAKNPLLLTIIALIHRYEAYLPRDRHQLYNRAVETLLTNWDAGKDIDYQWPLQHLKRDAVRRVMEQLAYWIHREGSVGDDEGGTLIDRDELIEQLGGFIKEEAGCKRYEAEQDATRFLEFIRSRTGLLNEQGQDRYAFVHKTFQEYLTAEDIRYRQVEDGFEVVREHIDDNLHDPHWEEVLLLLIAQQPKKRVAQLVPQILDHDTPYEQWLHRNFFFVADCLGENVKLSDASQVDAILSQLVDFVIAESPLISFELQQRAEKCLRNLGETDFEPAALQCLEQRSAQLEACHLQQLRFEVGQEASAIAQLVRLLEDDDFDVRVRAAYALSQLGQASDAVLKALMKRLEDDDRNVRVRAAAALSQLGQGNDAVLKALLKRLEEDDDSDVRHRAAATLGQLGQGSDAVLKALMKRLDDDDSNVRSFAAAALGQLGQGSDAVLKALMKRLDDEDSNVRVRAAAALGQLGQASDAVLKALMKRLDDEDSNVRSFAATALSQLGQGNDAVLKALMKRLDDED
ncbi:MAG: HEAT repeat domain-containing protein, partial [Cyanobacteria bacterium J06638_20]